MNKGVPISDLPIVAEIPDGSLLPAVVEGTTSAVEIETLRARVQTDLSDYYTKAETNELVSKIPKFAIEVVDTLPTDNISNTTVYLVKSSAEVSNLYTEYIYVNGNWEELGEQTVDLSNYYTKQETDAAIEAAMTEGGGAKLYEEYGENTDGALTQKFVSDVLNSKVVKIGSNSQSGATINSVAIGIDAKAQANSTVALGSTTTAASALGIAIGYNANVSNNGTMAIGASSSARSNYTVAIGAQAASTQQQSTAVGYYSIASGSTSTALGNYSTASGNSSIALGSHAKASPNSSVAIGSYSVAGRPYEVSIGDPSATNNPTRYLANVTAGELDTDAVNKKQMEDYVAEYAPYKPYFESKLISGIGTGSTPTWMLNESVTFDNLDKNGKYLVIVNSFSYTMNPSEDTEKSQLAQLIINLEEGDNSVSGSPVALSKTETGAKNNLGAQILVADDLSNSSSNSGSLTVKFNITGVFLGPGQFQKFTFGAEQIYVYLLRVG